MFERWSARHAAVGILALAAVTGRVYAVDYHTSPARIEREWRYLGRMAEGAAKKRPESKGAFDALLGEIRGVDLAAGPKELAARHAALSAKVLKLLHPETEVFVTYAAPFARLRPSEPPPVRAVLRQEITALPGEYQAAGITLANGGGSTVRCRLSITGFDAARLSFVVRRQGFVEHAHAREKERIADPLPKLPEKDGARVVELAAGETARLCLICRVPDDAGARTPGKAVRHEGAVRVAMPGGRAVAMPLTVVVLPAPRPGPETFPFLAFARMRLTGYTTRIPEVAAADLAAHGVTMVQVNALPQVAFTPEGEIASIDFSLHDRILEAYAPHLKRFLLHWPALYYPDFGFKADAKPKHGSEIWLRAYVNLLKAWEKHVRKAGYGPERFVHLPDDEPASWGPGPRPTERVKLARKLADLTKSTLPGSKVAVTICDYAFAEDVRLLIPGADIVLVGLPYRTQLPRNAPKTYDPRVTLREVVWPLMKEEATRRGMAPWTYHCQSGKNGDVLRFYRGWPVRQAAAGRTGTAHWAYDDYNGSSWIDTDGKRLDFTFNYVGTEDHPMCRRLNPTKEPLVPSIRYEALRAGLQDARILTQLEKGLAGGDCPAAVETEIRSLLAEGRRYETDPKRMTHAKMEAYAKRLRRVWSALSGGG